MRYKKIFTSIRRISFWKGFVFIFLIFLINTGTIFFVSNKEKNYFNVVTIQDLRNISKKWGYVFAGDEQLIMYDELNDENPDTKLTVKEAEEIFEQFSEEQKQSWNKIRNDFLPYWKPNKIEKNRLLSQKEWEFHHLNELGLFNFDIYPNIYFVGRDITWAQIVNAYYSDTRILKKNVIKAIINVFEKGIMQPNTAYGSFKKFKSVLLWNPLQSWLSTATSTKNAVTIDGAWYNLSSLWDAREIVDWNNLNTQAKKLLIRLLDGSVTPAKLKVALAVEDKTLTNQDKDEFWSRLKAVFNKFGSDLPNNKVTIMNKDHELKYLFNFRDRQTQNGQFAGSTADVRGANNALQKIFANKVTILEIETKLKELNALRDAGVAITQFPDSQKSSALTIGLATIGGGTSLLGVSYLVLYFLKSRK